MIGEEIRSLYSRWRYGTIVRGGNIREAFGKFPIVWLRHAGQRQSYSAYATKETCGKSSHQQLLSVAARPQVKTQVALWTSRLLFSTQTQIAYW